MSATTSWMGPKSARIDHYLMTTPAAELEITFLDEFSQDLLISAFKRLCDRFKEVHEKRSCLKEEFKRLRGSSPDPHKDDESLGFYARTFGSEEFVEMFCGDTGEEAIGRVTLDELKGEIINSSKRLDNLVEDVAVLSEVVAGKISVY